MNILIFQIAIFFIIVFASYLGKRPLIITCIFISVFTIVMVKTSPLMILQFFTIIYSFSFCFRRIERNEKEKEILKSYTSKHPNKLTIKRKKSEFELIIGIIVSLIIIVSALFGLYKWIFFVFDIDDGFMIFLAILNSLLFGTIAYIIIEFTYYGITESISELFNKKT